MGPELASLGVGALNAAGALHANITTQHLTKEQMRFQREQSNTQMAFQERMSNTSYQRAVADMEKAGINPILAFNTGGASTPPGAGGAGATAQVQNVAAGAISSALEARRSFAELDNLRQQNKQIASQTRLNKDMSLAAQADALVKQTTAHSLAYDLPRQKFVSDMYQTGPGKAYSVGAEIGKYLGPFLRALGGARTILQ